MGECKLLVLSLALFYFVIPAKAGIQGFFERWIPAYAGMTTHCMKTSYDKSILKKCQTQAKEAKEAQEA